MHLDVRHWSVKIDLGIAASTASLYRLFGIITQPHFKFGQFLNASDSIVWRVLGRLTLTREVQSSNAWKPIVLRAPSGMISSRILWHDWNAHW